MIYRHIHRIQETCVEHSFLIHYLNLKNKKREGKRFIDFLKGAKAQFLEILRHETVRFDHRIVGDGFTSIYEEAYAMIDTKLLQEIKQSQPAVLKQHATQKMHLITYYTSLGSLKILNLIHAETVKSE